jgi:hypothetical protein
MTTRFSPIGPGLVRQSRTCPVPPPRDVTRAAVPITASPAGPLAGTGPPRHPFSIGGESLATRRGA